MNKMYEELAERLNSQNSKYIPRLFEMITDKDEATLMLAMPATVPELAQKTGFSTEKVDAMMKLLFQKGLVFYSKRTDPPTWRMCRSVGQFHDASILWPGAPRAFMELWAEFCDTEWIDTTEAAARKSSMPHMRVIPIDTTVDADQQILQFEDVKNIVESARRIAVVPCPCRLSAKKCDKPLEVCIQLNRAADYAIERGTGKELSKEEAIDVVKKAQAAGLIHMTLNSKTTEHVICNCCGCCCIMVPVLVQRGVGMLNPSRYLAKIDTESCTACGICEEECPFEAIRLEDTASVNPDKCFGCGVCAVVCPEGAITLCAIREPESVPG